MWLDQAVTAPCGGGSSFLDSLLALQPIVPPDSVHYMAVALHGGGSHWTCGSLPRACVMPAAATSIVLARAWAELSIVLVAMAADSDKASITV